MQTGDQPLPAVDDANGNRIDKATLGDHPREGFRPCWIQITSAVSWNVDVGEWNLERMVRKRGFDHVRSLSAR